MDLRGLIAAEADRRGVQVDLARACRALTATAAAFARRRARRPLVASAQRRRLARLVAALTTAEDVLGGLEIESGGSRRLALWRESVARQRGDAEALLVAAEHPRRSGPPRDAATRVLALEVAWILHREGLVVSAYPEGLLAQVARVVAERAGRRLPEGDSIRRLLRPAVAFCHRQGVQVQAPEASNSDLGKDPTLGAPYRQTH